MTSDFQNRIIAMDLRFPYIDKAEMMSITNSNDRYHAATAGLDAETAEKYGLDPKRAPDLMVAQFMAGKYIKERFVEDGLAANSVCEMCGMDKTLLSKCLGGSRPFSVTPSVLTPFCYNALHESCHRVMFGEEGRIDLPVPYSMTVKSLLSLDTDKRNAVLRYGQKKAEMFDWEFRQLMESKNTDGMTEPGGGETQGNKKKRGMKYYPNAPRREQFIIIRERIQMILDDTGRRPVHVLGPETPHILRKVIRQYMLESYEKALPRTSFLMYLSLELGLALDYFIAEDFTKFVSCFYTDDNGEQIELKDRDILQYIGTCAAVPPEFRAQMMGRAIGAAMENKK